MKFFKLIIIALLTQACASRGVKITANTPSRIEINGEYACDSTPCEISEICWMHGPELHVEAFPIDKTKGYTQKKDIGPYRCFIFSTNRKNVNFEMDSRPGIDIEQSLVNVPLKTKLTEEEKVKKLDFLKKMHDENKITDQVYKELVTQTME